MGIGSAWACESLVPGQVKCLTVITCLLTRSSENWLAQRGTARWYVEGMSNQAAMDGKVQDMSYLSVLLET